MIDLCILKHFHGLEISCIKASIFFHQANYTKDILKHSGMIGAQSCPTPLAQQTSDGGAICSSTGARNYQALIGVFHCLNFTLHSHTHTHANHVVASIWVLRYLNDTADLALLFHQRQCDLLRLHIYSNIYSKIIQSD